MLLFYLPIIIFEASLASWIVPSRKADEIKAIDLSQG